MTRTRKYNPMEALKVVQGTTILHFYQNGYVRLSSLYPRGKAIRRRTQWYDPSKLAYAHILKIRLIGKGRVYIDDRNILFHVFADNITLEKGKTPPPHMLEEMRKTYPTLINNVLHLAEYL